MNRSNVGGLPSADRAGNAVALQNAVLCAECDVVSDSPHDVCLVCGSRSLLNVSRIFGGNLPSNRATLIRASLAELEKPERVPTFSRIHRVRQRGPHTLPPSCGFARTL